MMRFRNLVYRINEHPPEEHAYNAVASIGRLKDEGIRFWKSQPPAGDRWNHYCDDLFRFLNAEMGERRFLRKQSLETALVEFIHEFEHHTGRIHQMLHAKHIAAADRLGLVAWIDHIYRFSTYAILTFWRNPPGTKPRAALWELVCAPFDRLSLSKACKVPRRADRKCKEDTTI